ncbi:hypothetical protein DB29_02544 [Shouchella clausii]|nr:hypothetical protein DB29_02544 [Shouchella clausii]
MPEQKERIKRRKENQRLAMENDILKRADGWMDAWSERERSNG